jgi:hypothetical protein
MFKIKEAQVAALAEAEAKTFPERLLAFLLREVPEACDAGAAEKARRAAERASCWGLAGERDVATFAVLAFVHGMEFDQEPWARDTLARRDAPASTRIHLVYEAAVRRAEVGGTALAGKEAP